MPNFRRWSVLLGFALALAAFGLAGTNPAGAQQTQIVAQCPVPASAVSNGVDVCVDRGPGSLYYEGEPITICATVNIPTILIFPPPPDPTVRVTSSVAGGGARTVLEFSTRSGSRCTTATVQPPLGQETLRADVVETNGRVIASDTVTFRSAPRGGGGGPFNVSVTVDRGAGGVYVVGDNLQVCVTIGSGISTTRYNVRLVNTVNGVLTRTHDIGDFAGSRCSNFTVAAPTGQESMQAEVRDRTTGGLVATGTVSYITTGGYFPPPPLPLPPAPGGPSGPPSRFSGSVILNGQPAPYGTLVQAFVNGVPCGSGAVTQGGSVSSYVIDVGSGSATPGCGWDGATVSFVAGNVPAYETGIFQTGAFVRLNLTANPGVIPPYPPAYPPPPSYPPPYYPPATPAAPVNLRAVAIDFSQVQLSWTDTTAAEAGFRISDGYLARGTTGPNITTFVVTGLTPNTSYCFQVTAFFGGYDSPVSDWACVWTAPAYPAPAPPQGLTATPWSGGVIRLDWYDSSGDEQGFRIYNGNDAIGTVAANTGAFFAAGLDPGSWNCFRVAAFSDAGESPASDWACAWTPFYAAAPEAAAV